MGSVSADAGTAGWKTLSHTFLVVKFDIKSQWHSVRKEQSKIYFLLFPTMTDISLMEENGLYFNNLGLLITIYQPVMLLRDWLAT